MITRRSLLGVFAGSLAAVCAPLAKAAAFVRPVPAPTQDDKIIAAMRMLNCYGVQHFVVRPELQNRLAGIAKNRNEQICGYHAYGQFDVRELYFRGKRVIPLDEMTTVLTGVSY